jgi:hypothetical protein
MGRSRNKLPPKTLTEVKSDFIAALENATHEAGMLLTTVETLLRYVRDSANDGKLSGNKMSVGMRAMLEERCKGLRDALYVPIDLGDRS